MLPQKWPLLPLLKMQKLRCNWQHSTQTRDLVLFPELSITGYTCADLFAQSYLIQQAMEATLWLAEQLPQQGFAGMAVVGLPVQADNQLFNCAAFLQDGKILALVPKRYLPNYREFYEKRWFAPASSRYSEEIILSTTKGIQHIPFGENLLISNPEGTIVVAADIAKICGHPFPPAVWQPWQGPM